MAPINSTQNNAAKFVKFIAKGKPVNDIYWHPYQHGILSFSSRKRGKEKPRSQGQRAERKKLLQFVGQIPGGFPTHFQI